MYRLCKHKPSECDALDYLHKTDRVAADRTLFESSMFDSTQTPVTRKRRAPTGHTNDEAHPSQYKRQRLSPSAHRRHPQPSATFWDELSQLVFCRQGLKEFDRRTRTEQDQSNLFVPGIPDLPGGKQLTKLKQFARRGGPSLSYVRGFASMSAGMSISSGQSRKRSSASGRTGSTKLSKTSPYSGQYEAGLRDAHIYIEGYDYDTDELPEPNNLSDIQQRLTLSRGSLSPSQFTEEKFKAFKRATAQSRSETRMMQRVMRDISGSDDHFKTEADVEFNNIQPFNKSFAAAKPDLYDGALTSSVRKQVRDDLSRWVEPSTNSTNPIAPNFFLEAKSEKGRADVAKKQACHDGAIGARAMHGLQNYGAEEPEYDGNAYSFSATYHTGHLQLYATHPTAPAAEGEPAEYHMTQIDSFAMTGNIRTCREGMKAYRNAREMAKEYRDKHITKANAVACAMPADSPPSSRLTQLEHRSVEEAFTKTDSDTSVDELALSPAPSKRLRHERTTPAPPRTPLLQGDLLTLSTTSAESVASSTEDADLPRPGRSERPKQPETTKPTQVATSCETLEGRSGRVFEYNGKNVFVLDKEWEKTTVSKRPALFCARYNLWCFE